MLHQIAFAVIGGIEKLLHRNIDLADVLIAKVPLAAEIENEGEAVSPSGGLVDGEFDREIPDRVAAALFVDGSFEFLVGFGVGVGGDELDDDVSVHFHDEIDVVEVSGGDDLDLHGSFHDWEIFWNGRRRESEIGEFGG